MSVETVEAQLLKLEGAGLVLWPLDVYPGGSPWPDEIALWELRQSGRDVFLDDGSQTPAARYRWDERRKTWIR